MDNNQPGRIVGKKAGDNYELPAESLVKNDGLISIDKHPFVEYKL